jgi:hypothetical protein
MGSGLWSGLGGVALILLAVVMWSAMSNIHGSVDAALKILVALGAGLLGGAVVGGVRIARKDTGSSRSFLAGWNIEASSGAAFSVLAGMVLFLLPPSESDLEFTPSATGDAAAFRGLGVPSGVIIHQGISVEAVHSGKVFDVAGGSSELGIPVIQYERRGQANQQFRLEALDDGTYRIVSERSNLVLDVSGHSTEPGAKIMQYTWHGGDNQRFRVESLGDGKFRVIAKHSGLTLEVEGGSIDDGAQIQQGKWDDKLYQQFRFRKD